MLNLLRPALNRLLTPVGEALARTPVTPNAITVTGTVVLNRDLGSGYKYPVLIEKATIATGK